MSELRIERTGKVVSIASSEFRVYFPDGTEETFWSPVWHDWDEQTENNEAWKHAQEMWDRKKKKKSNIFRIG
jgi:hypothetical protein